MCIQATFRLNNKVLYLYGMHVCLIKTVCSVLWHLRQLAPPRGSRGDVLIKHVCEIFSAASVRVSGWMLTLLEAKVWYGV